MKATLGVLMALMLGAVSAWAALGEYESSVRADQQMLGGTMREEVHPGYKLHQITTSNGTVVREYVSPEGKVFGIAWQGPFVPNLQQLLGTYFAELDAYARAQTERRAGPLSIKTDDLVFASGGHMRSYRGRAYAPKLLPNSVSAGVVQ